MAGELTNKAREIKQALLELQAAGRTTTANMQEVLAFLDKLASGQALSGLNYLKTGLNQVSLAMTEMGATSKLKIQDMQSYNAWLLQLGQSTRVLAAEDRALRGVKRRGQWIPESAESASNKWLYRNVDSFKNEQEAYLEYRKKLQSLRSIEEAREYTKKGQAVPMGQLIDPDLPKVNEDFFKGLGYSSEATERLRKRLEGIGFSSANVTRNVTEMSTGITQLAFRTGSAETGFRTFHATMDRAGNILDDTQKRFRTFGNAIVRDVVEVLKWSIAIGLVYGPMRKLTELMEQAAKIQSYMAEVQIALGESTTNLSYIFESAAEVANETSSSIEGVIEGYNEAYSASGSVANQYERVATANALLRDSMVLAKLAGIDQSQALDTLVGGLRQSGRELYQGQELLDGWVAVSKNANVTLNQLASTFAIVGTAAEDVGITVDQLNAIVGTLAESTKLSADETGNAIRGFVSGFQSAKAEETLARYGIAVRTTSGEVRAFTDLLEELSVLSQSGVLNERAVAEITNVIGGGFRRGAQLAALFENYNRVLALTEISMNANGDAARALDIKMGTLDGAITRLGNSFTVLAQSLGGEGGMLGILTGIVDALTKVTLGVSALINVLEGAAPALATLGVLAAVAKTGTGITYLSKGLPTVLSYLFARNLGQQRAAGQTVASPPGQGLLGGIPLQPGITTGKYLAPTWLDLGRKINESVTKSLSKIPLVGGKLSPLGAGGLVVPGALIASQAAQGEYGKAGITLAGSFGAALVSGGSTWITAAGAILATAFYDKFLEFEPDFSQRWAELIIDAQRKAGEGAPGAEGPEKPSIAELESAVADTLNWQERLTVNSRTLFINLADNFYDLVNKTTGQKRFPTSEETLTNIDLLTQTFLKQREGQRAPAFGEDMSEWLMFGGSMKPGLLGAPEAGQLMDENTYRAMQELFNEFILISIEEGLSQTPTQKAIISTQDRLASIAASAAEDLVVEALDDISKGIKGSVEQYIDASRIETSLSLSAANLIVATQTAQQAVPTTTLETPTPQRAVGFVAGLTSEEAKVLTQLTGEITTNFEKINALSEKGYLTPEDQAAMAKYRADLEAAVASLEQLLPALEQATDLRDAQMMIKPIIDLPDNLTGAEQLDLIQQAERYWRYILEKQGMSEEQIRAYVAAEQEKLIRADKEILDYRTKAPQEMVGAVTDILGLGGQADPFQFMDLRDKLGVGQIDSVLQRYQQISSAFKANIPGFELELDPVTLILKEGFKNMDLDMRLFNLAMQELIDIEKQQMVEGMFNLPSGATFFVPFEPASLDARSRANQGGSYLDPESLFAQYPPDPNAMEGAVQEGAKQGVLEGLSSLEKTGTLEGAKFEKIINERLYGPEKVEEGWRIPEVLPTPYEPVTPAPAPTSTPTGQAPRTFLEALGFALNATPAGQYLEEKAGGIKDAIMGIKEYLLDPLLNINRDSGDLKSLQRDEPLKKGDLTTYMNLQISSTSNLILNDQQIGQAVTSYLEQSMLRYDDTAGSINKVVVL